MSEQTPTQLATTLLDLTLRCPCDVASPEGAVCLACAWCVTVVEALLPDDEEAAP